MIRLGLNLLGFALTSEPKVAYDFGGSENDGKVGGRLWRTDYECAGYGEKWINL